MSAKILFVDDDRALLSMQQLSFNSAYTVDTAESVAAAFTSIERRGPYAAIVSDLNMPHMSGVEFLAQMTQRAPDTIRIMVTGEAGQQAPIDAVNRSQVFRFLTKPCRHSEMRGTLEAAVARYHLVTAERDLLEKTLSASVKVLSEILSVVQPAIFGRTEKLRRYLRHFHYGTALGELWQLDVAGMLAPIGLVTLPGHAAHGAAPGALRSPAEEALYASVPRIGHRLIADIPRMEAVAQVILYQQQRFDARGALPGNNARGEAIPLGARILKIFADLVSLEVEGASVEGAFAEMRKAQPGCYDPKLFAAAYELLVPKTNVRLERKTRQVTLSQLKPGQVLAGHIYTKHGLLVIADGAEVTPVLLSRLVNFAEISGLREPIEIEEEQEAAA